MTMVGSDEWWVSLLSSARVGGFNEGGDVR